MSATLQMIFSNAEGRNSTISVTDPDPALSTLDVQEVMDAVITGNVFETTGGDLISKVRAQVVTRTVDVLGEF